MAKHLCRAISSFTLQPAPKMRCSARSLLLFVLPHELAGQMMATVPGGLVMDNGVVMQNAQFMEGGEIVEFFNGMDAGDVNRSAGGNSTTLAVKKGRDRLREMALKMRDQQMRARNAAIERTRQFVKEAREAPATWMGGVVVPIVVALALLSCVVHAAAPAQHDEVARAVHKAVDNSRVRHWIAAVRAEVSRRGWTVHDATRLCVCTFFLHEGFSVVQLKLDQIEEAAHPVWTPFGAMQSMPSWEKGDACDMVLLVSALATMFNLMPEIGMLLLFVDVATDTLDLLMRILLTYLFHGHLSVNELTAKKLSLLVARACQTTPKPDPNQIRANHMSRMSHRMGYRMSRRRP